MSLFWIWLMPNLPHIFQHIFLLKLKRKCGAFFELSRPWIMKLGAFSKSGKMKKAKIFDDKSLLYELWSQTTHPVQYGGVQKFSVIFPYRRSATRFIFQGFCCRSDKWDNFKVFFQRCIFWLFRLMIFGLSVLIQLFGLFQCHFLIFLIMILFWH